MLNIVWVWLQHFLCLHSLKWNPTHLISDPLYFSCFIFFQPHHIRISLTRSKCNFYIFAPTMTLIRLLWMFVILFLDLCFCKAVVVARVQWRRFWNQVIFSLNVNFLLQISTISLYIYFLFTSSPESLRYQQGIYYLYPERCCVPDSPTWFSSQPVQPASLSKMLHRALMVKEVQESFLEWLECTLVWCYFIYLFFSKCRWMYRVIFYYSYDVYVYLYTDLLRTIFNAWCDVSPMDICTY